MGNEQLLTKISELTGVGVKELIQLQQCNMLDEKNKIRILILHEYYIKLKQGEDSLFNVKLDLAVKYDVSDAFVHHSIYKYPSLYTPFL